MVSLSVLLIVMIRDQRRFSNCLVVVVMEVVVVRLKSCVTERGDLSLILNMIYSLLMEHRVLFGRKPPTMVVVVVGVVVRYHWWICNRTVRIFTIMRFVVTVLPFGLMMMMMMMIHW